MQPKLKQKDGFFQLNPNLGKGSKKKKKKKGKIPKGGGGGPPPIFQKKKKKKKKKNMGLKHWILPKDHFKTHLFFSIFGWGDPSQLGSWSEGCVKPLKLSREAI